MNSQLFKPKFYGQVVKVPLSKSALLLQKLFNDLHNARIDQLRFALWYQAYFHPRSWGNLELFHDL